MRKSMYAVDVGVLCLSLLVSGCVSVKYNYSPKATTISEPPLNTTVTAYVGDNMLQQGRYIEHDAIYVRHDIKVGPWGGYNVSQGTYRKVGEDEYSEFYVPGGPEAGVVTTSSGIMKDTFQAIRVDKRTGKLCCVDKTNDEYCTAQAHYERTTFAATSQEGFQQTLIYSGKVGEKINIGYREFSSNLARPAFNNDVEYDLSESNIIGYKEARIEVLEATNEHIKYKVIQHFARPKN